MERADRLEFAQFFYLVAVGDGRSCASFIIDTAMAVPVQLARARFEAEIVSLVETLGRTPGNFSVSSFVIRLFDIQRRHGIIGAPQFMSAILSLFVFEGIVRHWLPDLNFQREAQRYIFLGSFPQEQNSRDAKPSEA